MQKTAQDTPATKAGARVPRWLLMTLPVLIVIGAVAVVVPKVLGDDDSSDGIVFSSTTRQVTYEVLGSGRSDQIVYTSGANNAEKTVEGVKLPWKITLDLPVGVAGGTANVIARNPETGGDVTCRISVAGKVLSEVSATDGYVDPSCSVPMAAERAK